MLWDRDILDCTYGSFESKAIYGMPAADMRHEREMGIYRMKIRYAAALF